MREFAGDLGPATGCGQSDGDHMSRILVANAQPGAGSTTVAAGLGYRFALAGRAVRFVRLAGDARAEVDARTYATFELGDTSGVPVADADLPADDETITIIEAPAGQDGVALAQRLGAKLVLVTEDASVEADGATVIANHQRYAGPNAISETRLLAAPTVARLIEASGATVLSRSEDGDQAICEHLVVGAISHDAADTYFNRFPRRCVVARAEKVDLALAAMLTRSECLILTGGHEPSPYLLDRAASTRETTLLLAPEGTVETLRDIEGSFGTSPFSHEAKLERISALLGDALDASTLASLAG